MNTIVACFLVALAVVVLGQPQGAAVCIDKDCHQKCTLNAGYSIGVCMNEVCECVPINTSQDVVNHEENIRGSIIGKIVHAVTGDCNMISCAVSCVKKKSFGGCLLGKCQCF